MTARQIYGFPYGQLDPEFVARRDLKSYYLAGQTVLNMAPRAAGGLDRRPGLAYIAEITAAATGIRLASFERNAETFYLIAFVAGAALIYRDGQYKATVTLPYSAAEIAALDWTQSWDTMLLFHPAHQPRKLMWGGDDATWTLAAVSFTNPPTRQYGADTTGKATPSGKTGAVTITSTASDFATAIVGMVVHLPNGHGTITAKASDTSVTVQTNDEFKNTDGAEAGDWSIEDTVWSDARGWPETGRFDGNGRLFLGSANSVFGSRPGQYFDLLTTSDSLDDDAVDVALDDDQANQIRSIFNADHLIVLTSGGPFSVPDAPVTPKNFYLKRVNRTKAAKIRPVEVDGVVAFVSDGADGAYMSVFELAPEPAADSRYSCRDLAMMASTVLKRPVDMAARRGTGTNSANYLFCVNDDGTIGVLHSRREQQVTAWTPWVTDGHVLAVTVVGNTAIFVVRRVIAGATRYFIERLDPDHLGDCSVRQTSVTAKTGWTGLDHLDGHAVRVVADGAVVGTVTVAGGAIALPHAASMVEVGLPFAWKVEPMPVEAQLADGTLVGTRARIWKVVAQVQATGEIWIDGKRVELRRFGTDRFDTAPPRFTGEIPVRLLGRRKTRTIAFEGFDMVPATLLSVTLFVSN